MATLSVGGNTLYSGSAFDYDAFPDGMPIQVVSFKTTGIGNFELTDSDLDTDPDIFRLITPKRSGSSFLVSVRWIGEIDIPQDCVFNIQRVVSGASTVRVNAPGTDKWQGLFGFEGPGADDDSTPNSCTFQTLDETGSTAGTDITFRLVACCSSASTSNSIYTNKTATGASGQSGYERFSSEIIITEIAG